MNTNFKDNEEKILKVLKERVGNIECPICNHNKFGLANGYFAHDLQNDLKNRNIGGPSIPTIPLVCKNCGYVAEFAVGALGLLPNKEKEDKKNKQKDVAK